VKLTFTVPELWPFFLLEDRDFKGFWMKIWNAEVSVITRSTFSSITMCSRLPFYYVSVVYTSFVRLYHYAISFYNYLLQY